MALLLREEDVQPLLTMDIALQAVEDVLQEQGRGQAANVSRSRVGLAGGLLHVMSAAVPSLGIMGLKAYTRSDRGFRFVVLLFEGASGQLLALLEADKLSQMRTGAASGVATKYMARPQARVVGIYGSGWQARGQLMAVCAVRPIQRVKAYSRDRQRLEAFCREMSESLGLEVRPLQEPAQVAQDSDIVITATTAAEPVLLGQWLGEGAHINAIGANHILRRELDEEVVRRASLVVVDSLEQAKVESGDLFWPIEQGYLRWEQVRELGQVVAGLIPSRQRDADITLFKSHGIALWDVATAARVYALARERGLGEEVRLLA